ncbi:hypothetical protein [Corynebacterium lipophiloflavum]|uniref:Uncharacterized protein n=1 Tax=Corynebacterium lipophiloflavum (strain ATCC 700352 / DSM 44291 / CCUG 37336 / JCM 10383 / DMMZ 1944) TaxID=525263 RepID=C0XTK1_CORLD|nr:hypothetical protein [Corynebacterium lipophiloflavum]EEI16420.1 hypothetical protein HMPREF0298_1771 [Corynebacterium lipophiloflavum DSM 44291]
MNPFTIRLAFKGARSAMNYYRKLDDEKKRDIYDSVVDAVKKDKIDDKLDGLYNVARREAGALTRDSHDRLDRHRAQFAAAAPERAERRLALKQEAKDAKKKSKGSAGSVIATVLGVGAATAAGWAAWEFFLKDKFTGGETKNVTYTRVEPREETSPSGETTLVYSSRTEDDREKTAGSAGPLGEEPAERDEQLLSSIDEQLTTLDTLDDDERDATR